MLQSRSHGGHTPNPSRRAVVGQGRLRLNCPSMPGTYCDLFRRRLISSDRFAICAYSAATLSMISLDRLSFIDAAYSRERSPGSLSFIDAAYSGHSRRDPASIRRYLRDPSQQAVQCSGKSPYRDAKRPRASWHVNIPEKFVLTIINSTTFAIAVPYPRATSEQEVSRGGAPRNRVRNKTRDRQSRVGVDHPHLTLQRRQGSRHQGARNLCCGSGYRAMAPSTI